MGSVSIKVKGSFNKTRKMLASPSDFEKYRSFLDACGREGVARLSEATPRDTGTTAQSWFYKLNVSKNQMTISWGNSNINDGVPIAIIIQYGHGTGTGGYVEGVDYIPDAIRPVLEKIQNEIGKGVSK